MSNQLMNTISSLLHSVEWSPASTISPGTREQYEQGLDLLLAYRGHPDKLFEAIKVFQAIPSRPYAFAGAAYTVIAASYLSYNDYDPKGLAEAKPWLTQAQSLAPNQIEINFLDALLHLLQGEVQETRTILDALAQEPPNYYVGIVEMRYWEHQRDIHKVHAWYQKALNVATRDEQRIYAINMVAGSLLDAGLPKHAAEYYEDLIKYKPNDPWLWHNLSIAYYRQKDYQQAWPHNQRALGLMEFGAAREMEKLIRERLGSPSVQKDITPKQAPPPAPVAPQHAPAPTSAAPQQAPAPTPPVRQQTPPPTPVVRQQAPAPTPPVRQQAPAPTPPVAAQQMVPPPPVQQENSPSVPSNEENPKKANWLLRGAGILMLLFLVCFIGLCAYLWQETSARTAEFAPLIKICEGRAVSEAAAYQPTAGIHPIMVLDRGIGDVWTTDILLTPDDWEASTLAETELALCVEEQKEELLERCPYGNLDEEDPTIENIVERYQYTQEIRLLEAQTGEILAQETIAGDPPRECLDQEAFRSGEDTVTVKGEEVSDAELKAWLAPYVDIE